MNKVAQVVLRLAAALTGGLVLASACDITESVLETLGAVWDIVDTWA